MLTGMLTSVLGAAVALGFLGSLHCAAMCGPLALAGCCVDGRTSPTRALSYFGGRLTSYAFLGAAFGAVGAHLGCKIPLHQLQLGALALVVVLALARGVQLLWSQVQPASELVSLSRKRASWWSRLTVRVASLVPRRAVWLGLVTGALPCGMLVGAWGLAASTGRPVAGALTMAAFSFATAPALIASLFAAPLARRFRWASTPMFQGLLWCVLALWIGARSFLAHGAHGAHGGH